MAAVLLAMCPGRLLLSPFLLRALDIIPPTAEIVEDLEAALE